MWIQTFKIPENVRFLKPKSFTIFQLPKILIRAMITIPADEDMLIVKSSFILTSMGKKHKIKLTEMDIRATLDWLLNAIRINLCVGVCDILRAMEVILKSIDNDVLQVNEFAAELPQRKKI